nr:receptor expression-enhancing protein 4 [Columba livia]
MLAADTAGTPLRSRLLFGMLYPAYASYKAVRTKNIREYVSRVAGGVGPFPGSSVTGSPPPLHPTLSRKEKEIDTYIVQARERSYEMMVRFGKRGLNLAATAAVQAATKSQGALAGRLRSFSMQDLRSIPDETPMHYQDPLYLEEQENRRQLLAHSTPSAARRYDSETEDEEFWSDSQIFPEPSPRQSLRAARRTAPSKEGSSRILRSRIRRKAAPPEQDS